MPAAKPGLSEIKMKLTRDFHASSRGILVKTTSKITEAPCTATFILFPLIERLPEAGLHPVVIVPIWAHRLHVAPRNGDIHGRFPLPMLGMAIGERHVAALIMPVRRDIKPVVRIGEIYLRWDPKLCVNNFIFMHVYKCKAVTWFRVHDGSELRKCRYRQIDQVRVVNATY